MNPNRLHTDELRRREEDRKRIAEAREACYKRMREQGPCCPECDQPVDFECDCWREDQ